MKHKITRQEVMKSYYSDEELKYSLRVSVVGALKWLEEARCFFGKITPKKTKQLREKLVGDGW